MQIALGSIDLRCSLDLFDERENLAEAPAGSSISRSRTPPSTPRSRSIPTKRIWLRERPRFSRSRERCHLASARFAFPSTEQGLSLEHESPITPIAWISISIPGRAKFVTVMSALPG